MHKLEQGKSGQAVLDYVWSTAYHNVIFDTQIHSRQVKNVLILCLVRVLPKVGVSSVRQYQSYDLDQE